MSTLTGQQIKDTYDGLLKLADSTTGITSTYQQIQDGLGNDTNTRISTNGILSPTVIGMYNQLNKADYYGNGFQATGAVPIANSQNRTNYHSFYDPGVFSYSAISYNLGTLTSTSDVVNIAFYTTQMVPITGIAPKDLIMSGITLESSTSTGVKTTALPSTLSFSGTGGGFYLLAYYITNSGVTPTVRFAAGTISTFNQAYVYNIGFFLNPSNNALVNGQRNNTFPLTQSISLPLQQSYTSNDITSNISSTIFPPTIGFGLKPI